MAFWCQLCRVQDFNVEGLEGTNLDAHHASEGQKTKLVGGDLLEQLLMTTAPTAKRYMSMIMRGLCHKSACPV